MGVPSEVPRHTPIYKGAVLLGNYVEERAKKELPSRTPVFSSVSEAHEQFGAKGKFGPGIAVQRVDWLKTHSSSGPSLLYHATPGNGQPDLYHSTLNQLVQGADGSKRIQDFLWTGHKAVDLAIPKQAEVAPVILPKKQALWEREKKSQVWETSSHESAAAAASLAAAGACLRAPRPSLPTGCKATGDSVRLFDKDYLKMGLRK